ncbi:hypothetical protein COV15_00960 [Candidatus Woesearchaeota archaeon CG10_big_fil_rev_8_21_14_0_10_34_12]|nr:MAG: hypothetical protein COV15_00960 [Candidatus Woesearchaeota archaeon CG10_big_fil_rev_8_21_14_0_10_34_12]
MANNINVPSGFGGLVMFKEEYDSKVQLSPAHVVAGVIVTILFVLALKIFFPVA